MLKVSLMASLILLCGSICANEYPNWLVAMTESQNGGVIELTAGSNAVCTGDWHIAGTFDPPAKHHKPIYGCWKFNDIDVTIAWNDGDVQTYDLDDFEWATWATGENEDLDAPPHKVRHIKHKSGDILT